MKKTERPAPVTAAHGSMRARAYAHIQARIARRELRAGMPVSELALAKELGSSRTPIREAISQLVSEGLLEQTPNRGAVVIQLTRQDVVDLYELREALEVFAVGKAARRPVAKTATAHLIEMSNEIKTLRDELVKSKREFLNASEMHRFISADLGFHTLLMRIADNSRILRVVNETRLLIRIFAMRRRGHSAKELDRIHRHHLDIVAALEAGDSERVMRTLADHIRVSQQESLDEFDHWAREQALNESMPAFFDLATESDLPQ